jgi:ethanolamine utilization protein EutA (predicted chaperonin)
LRFARYRINELHNKKALAPDFYNDFTSSYKRTQLNINLDAKLETSCLASSSSRSNITLKVLGYLRVIYDEAPTLATSIIIIVVDHDQAVAIGFICNAVPPRLGEVHLLLLGIITVEIGAIRDGASKVAAPDDLQVVALVRVYCP